MTPAVCLALVLYFEARNEDIAGQIAVAWSVQNSAIHLRHHPVSICYEAIRSHRYVGVNNGFTGTVPSGAVFSHMLDVSRAVIRHEIPDITKGAIAFECTKWRACKHNPWWAAKLQYAGQFGTQRFWRKK